MTSLTSLVPTSGSSGAPDSWAVALATLATAALFARSSGWRRVWSIAASTASSTTPNSQLRRSHISCVRRSTRREVLAGLLYSDRPNGGSRRSATLGQGWGTMTRDRWVVVGRWALVITFLIGSTLSLVWDFDGDLWLLLPIAIYTLVGAVISARRPCTCPMDPVST